MRKSLDFWISTITTISTENGLECANKRYSRRTTKSALKADIFAARAYFRLIIIPRASAARNSIIILFMMTTKSDSSIKRL